MQTLLAWVWTPVLLYLLCFGLGMLAVALIRVELPNAVLPPLGLALAVVLVTLVYRLGGTVSVAAPLLVLAALAGLVVGRRTLRERLNPGWAGVGAVGVYCLYLAPIVLAGHWTWGGYNFVNDTASNFIFADWVSHHGFAVPPSTRSTTDRIAASAINSGYPLGGHMFLGTLRPLAVAPLAAIYQPLLAASAGLGAMSFAALARRAGLRAWQAAAGGALSLGATLLYNYTLHGGIKEILVVALLATTTALALESADRGLDARVVALAALVVIAMVSVFSVAVGAAVVVVAVLVLATALAGPSRPSAKHLGRILALGLAVGLIAALPSLKSIADFGDFASSFFASSGGASTGYLGHLLRPLPISEASGVWLARDYRAPVTAAAQLPNAVLVVVVALLAVAGGWFELRGRRPSGMVLFLAGAIPVLALAARLGPYADAKLYVVLTPTVVLLAAVGAFRLSAAGSRAVRVAGIAGVLALAVGVLGSDALAYRSARLAPQSRMLAMTDAADHAHGGGLWLVNEWEEFSKFFMRSIRVNAASESASPKPVVLIKPRPIFGRYFDLDEQRLRYVTSFPGIITRRSPVASRPPASYRLTYQNRYYQVWRRDPGTRVGEHLPLQRTNSATRRPFCGEVRALARRVRPGERLVAAERPRPAVLGTAFAERSPAWKAARDEPTTVVPSGSGHAVGRLTTGAGRFRVWVRVTGGRPIGAYVDGRRVGLANQVNTPSQWLQMATIDLSAGTHPVELRRGGVRLAPGDGYTGVLGPLVLEPVSRSRLVSVPPSRARALCGRTWDWIERVRGPVS